MWCALRRTVPAVAGARRACASVLATKSYSSRPLPGDELLAIPKIFKDHTERTLYPEMPDVVPAAGQYRCAYADCCLHRGIFQ